LRASVSGGFRAPDFKELYLRFVNASAGYAVDGNAALRPEHSINTTAEAEWVSGGLDLRANVFHNRIRDLIETIGPDVQGHYTYDNVGLATTSGAELEAGRRWRAAEVRLGYSYLHTHDVTLGGPILGRAAHSGRGTIDTPVWRRLRLAVTGVYTGDSPAARDSLGRVSMVREGMMQVNMRAAHPIPAWAGTGEIFGGVDDVFDVQRGYDWPGFTGRQLSVGLSWPGR